ncbi:hypothetical protein CLUG_00937 [Clavispora lusitaniae ATCC 42720]|uniref:Uncharacterized protein n=1 Tax=Clavispora lusitaniae (strain ATCC 42720) TaxID=306902 RepID=C4XYB4_CLAL4|nr:uncharacterized protein CLUG_00937 [Clavispora lusitaniae ATCC 42720]EEQ36814.1 hypothetical protein CLUG_00937 [Clavispora lusitaniae ATCC 42720]
MTSMIKHCFRSHTLLCGHSNVLFFRHDGCPFFRTNFHFSVCCTQVCLNRFQRVNGGLLIKLVCSLYCTSQVLKTFTQQTGTVVHPFRIEVVVTASIVNLWLHGTQYRAFVHVWIFSSETSNHSDSLRSTERLGGQVLNQASLQDGCRTLLRARHLSNLSVSHAKIGLSPDHVGGVRQHKDTHKWRRVVMPANNGRNVFTGTFAAESSLPSAYLSSSFSNFFRCDTDVHMSNFAFHHNFQFHASHGGNQLDCFWVSPGSVNKWGHNLVADFGVVSDNAIHATGGVEGSSGVLQENLLLQTLHLHDVGGLFCEQWERV